MKVEKLVDLLIPLSIILVLMWVAVTHNAVVELKGSVSACLSDRIEEAKQYQQDMEKLFYRLETKRIEVQVCFQQIPQEEEQ